ncbi:MAG TPA: tetratricopeptide repeat protein [Gemmataceae bacterium]|nr:tetratricopeptide repeat protein [Gemmataceae bacterium]
MAISLPAPSRPAAAGPSPGPLAYVHAIGPRLKILLALIFAFVAVLGATGAYLGAITFLNWYKSPQTYTSPFTLWMFIGHVGIGVAAIVPFLFFGTFHFLTARNRPNRVAVRLGLLMFATGILVCLTGLALIQLEGMPQLPTGTVTRTIVYALHVVLPLAAVWLYVMHRRAGPDINWKWGYSWAGGTAAFVAATVVMHGMDPRAWYAEGPKEGAFYFHPSDSRTANGKFISAEVLMADEYCMKCHPDIYQDHLHSAHKFSSFNNPAYLFSVKETREFALKRDGDVKASRWCAGCHDPVPFFSGAFDNPDYDLVKDPTAHAGITCTVCHAITNINSTIGNGAYTIEEPQHYPFAFSKDPTLQWVNNQLIKAKPDFHKKTFLKPFHRTEEFCSTCHKVGLPVALNRYKDFLRGQNHYDSFLGSGVSGHGARAFYDPPIAKENCAACHMPLKPSMDFGSKNFDGTGVRKRHDHFFPGANTGLFELVKREDRYTARAAQLDEATKKNADFLVGTDPEGKDKKLRIDIFGLKTGAADSDQVIGPIRPELPKLTPGKSYVVEVVIRTLNVGHVFPQGTADSNEIWVDFEATAGGKEIARNGALKKPGTDEDTGDDSGEVDRWSHFTNVWMLDRNGNRIDRRNPQDIFTPLYDHQIPPGAANVVHYKLDVPADAKGPIELTARLRYRKFDYKYMKYVHKDQPVPKLPIVDICSDSVTLPVEGGADAPSQESPIKPAWQRWNDYGIACYIEAGLVNKRGQTKQAEAAFKKLLSLGNPDANPHAHLNLARIHLDEGRYDMATAELERARQAEPQKYWWKLAWLGARVNAESARDVDAAIADLRKIVDPANRDPDTNRDFTRDIEILNLLANLQFKQAIGERGEAQAAGLRQVIETAERAQSIDQEDHVSHERLWRCYSELATPPKVDVASPEASGDALSALGETLANQAAAKAGRIEAAAKLLKGIDAYREIAGDVYPPRLPTLRGLILTLRPAYHAEPDAEMQGVIAAVLATLHRISMETYKLDELARAHAATEFRKQPGSEAANYAARDRIIYPTTPAHRERILKTGNLTP